ncbi:MAG: hypothetical protein ACXWZS_02890 [Gemmatirosa sp.]
MIGKVQPYTPPKINQVPPNYRNSRWNEVRDVKEPFPGSPPAREFGFWFNYFWAEVSARGDLTDPQKKKAAETYFQVFEPAPVGHRVRADFAARDDAFKENVLRQLLLLGFERVALDAPQMTSRPAGRGPRVAPGPRVAVDASLLNLQMLDVKGGARFPIAFRSDSRSYEELCNHNGFRARARQLGTPVFTSYALDKAWHPFSNPVYRNSIFLRLGAKNADNCLQTAVSVGGNFAPIVHFPILNDYVLVFNARSADGTFLALKPLDEWTAQDVTVAATHFQKVRVVRGADGVIDHLEKDNHVHAFHLHQVRGFNTEARFAKGGDAFPERGIEHVPIENLLAELHFVQKWWFNPARGEIKLYEVAFSPIRWVPSQAYVSVVIGERGRVALETIILDEIGRVARRTDIASEGVEYRAHQQSRAQLLGAAERVQVLDALRVYLAPRPPGATTATEKAAVKAQLPALAAKIDFVPLAEWADMRRRVAPAPIPRAAAGPRPGFAPPPLPPPHQ